VCYKKLELMGNQIICNGQERCLVARKEKMAFPKMEMRNGTPSILKKLLNHTGNHIEVSLLALTITGLVLQKMLSTEWSLENS
jgi:hypothetical protein